MARVTRGRYDGRSFEPPSPRPPTPDGAPVADSAPDQISQERVPLFQRLFDNVFLLLALGLLIMLVIFSGWGMWEIVSLPPATLP